MNVFFQVRVIQEVIIVRKWPCRQRIVALELCAVLGVLACIFALPITFIDNIFAAVTCLWMVLFFGGSTLPACSGIIVSIVPRRHRPTSSSLSLGNMFSFSTYKLEMKELTCNIFSQWCSISSAISCRWFYLAIWCSCCRRTRSMATVVPCAPWPGASAWCSFGLSSACISCSTRLGRHTCALEMTDLILPSSIPRWTSWGFIYFW